MDEAGRIAARILEGDEVVAAKVISMIENGEKRGFEVLSSIFSRTGFSFRIGVTGCPGAGKSTIIDRLAVAYANRGKKVGIIAIDPTSIKSGGTLFGDRLRLKGAEKAEGVFIRSMAHRGFKGGIAKAAYGAQCILEALGKEIIIVESVGVGQTELDISLISDVVITVFTPDFGDEIQLMKAGLLDVGDILVINKMDLPDAIRRATDFETYIETLGRKQKPVSVVRLIATKGEGIEELVEKIEEIKASGEIEKDEKIKRLLLSLIKEEVASEVEAILSKEGLDTLVSEVKQKKRDPYSISREMLSRILREAQDEGKENEDTDCKARS